MKMKNSFPFFLMILASLTVWGQESTTKIVVDSETELPVSGAHIYKITSFKTGAVSNENGLFVVTSANEQGTIKITHIAYTSFIGTIANIQSDTIKLTKRKAHLNEIVINGISGKAIMESVIDSLYRNHFVEPSLYEVFVQVIEYEKDKSDLHVLSEYVMNVYQDKNSNSDFEIIKTRANYFSNTGKSYFEDMRMMDAIYIQFDNIFKSMDDIYKKKKLKKFNVEIIDESTTEGINIIQLKCTPEEKEKYSHLVLFIDVNSYAIAKAIKFYSPNEDLFNEVGFKEISGKWYLSYSKWKANAAVFNIWNKDSKAIVERQVIYNIKDIGNYNSAR